MANVAEPTNPNVSINTTTINNLMDDWGNQQPSLQYMNAAGVASAALAQMQNDDREIAYNRRLLTGA